MKFPGGSFNSRVAPNIDPEAAKIPIPADVVEMLFGIDDAQFVLLACGASVAVHGFRCQRICARVDHQGDGIAGDNTRIDAPGRRVAQAGYGIAAVSESHNSIVIL